MLSLIEAGHFAAKKSLLDRFNPDTQTWLVSDLKAKFSIQDILLEKKTCLEEYSVLRASELWQKLALRVLPDIRFVSHDLACTLIRNWQSRQDIAWLKSTESSRTLLDYIQRFLPLLSHPQGPEHMRSWFAENPAAVVRWQHWFELSLRAFQDLKELKTLPSQWAASLLLDQDLYGLWPRSLVVDLSSQITAVEVDLILQLSKQVDIQVLVPSGDILAFYPAVAQHYEKLGLNNRCKATDFDRFVGRSRGWWHRFSTQLAEVKFAVSQVRQWLEDGHPPHELAILAPNIEDYWGVLGPYLENEGLLVDKPTLSRIQSLPSMQLWLSQLRARLSEPTRMDLEQSLFISGKPHLSFDKFCQLFSRIYEVDDLNRDEKMARVFARNLAMDVDHSREEFFSWAIRFWPSDFETEPIEDLLQSVLQEVPPPLKLKAGLWLSYIEGAAARCEKALRDGFAGGIFCGNITQSEWIPIKRVVIMGLHHEALVDSTRNSLSAQDMERIRSDLGFAVSDLDQNLMQFELQMALEREFSEVKLCFSASDFDGGPLGPPLLWLLQEENLRLALEVVNRPGLTRWDEIHRASFERVAQIHNWTPDRKEVMLRSMLEDSGRSEQKALAVRPKSLSASSLEAYAECPFIFGAQRLFRLHDLPEINLDVDRMTRGLWLHSLFEKLTSEPFRSDWTNEELTQVLDTLKSDSVIPLPDERLWPSVRSSYLDLAQRFLLFEKSWREQFPGASTLGREVSVSGYWSVRRQALVREADEGAMAFRGRIDRVDGDDHRAIVIDYKSTGSNLTHHGAWLGRNEQLQLALYSQALEGGLTELAPRPVKSAVYFTAAPLDRSKGFFIEGEDDLYPAATSRSKAFVNEEGKSNIYSSINQRVGDLIGRMIGGDFRPKPKDQGLCQTCKWSGLCRAPHLN